MQRSFVPIRIVPVQSAVVANNPTNSSFGTIHIAPKPTAMSALQSMAVSTTANTGILPKTSLVPLAPSVNAAAPTAPATVNNAQATQAARTSPMHSNTNTDTVIAPRPAASSPSSPIPAETNASGKTSTVWYLGGNHIIKLLTSVDGDLDPLVLAKLATVPSVVGELALSVESLVSDDATVGGFEIDLLAKIASNTLTGKRSGLAAEAAAAVVAAAAPPPRFVSRSSSANSNTSAASTDQQRHQQQHQQQQQQQRLIEDESQQPEVADHAFAGHVPNPLLADYMPVPNPLARVTPPASPNGNGKREDCEQETVGPETKRMRPTAELSMVQAR
jgi:hypothetical protein